MNENKYPLCTGRSGKGEYTPTRTKYKSKKSASDRAGQTSRPIRISFFVYTRPL